MIKVSIIIPTYRRCESVKRLLKAMSNQTFNFEHFEVIVSIDGSEDGTREMIEQFNSPYRLLFLWEPNSGRATACNRGINKAVGEILIILDDDMEPSPKLVEAHYMAHRNNSKVGVLGAAPILIDKSSTLAARYIAAEFNSRQKKISKPRYEFKIWDFYGANFSIRKEVFIEAGAFNESFKVYGDEDIELAQRLIKNGVKFVYNADALCTQHYEDDFRSLAKKQMEGGKNSVLLVNLHPEIFSELYFSNYNKAGWKWRTIRILLIWTSMLIPITTEVIIHIVNLVEKSNSRIQLKVCHFAMDYFIWLGIWSAIKIDKKNKPLLDRIKSFKIPKKSSIY